jgi:hypothetical protein
MTYDNQDFTGWDLSDRNDMNGLTITGSCFSSEIPNAPVLPPDLKGVTFINCNLDNVYIPPGNKTIECSTRVFEVQADGEDWIIHPDTKEPIEPVNKQTCIEQGKNTDPEAIVAEEAISL